MIRRVWRFVVIAWALRTSWLTAAYVLGWAGVARHHVETAGFILAGLLLVAVAGKWGWAKNGVGSDFRGAGLTAPRKSLPTPFFDRPHFPDLAALAALALAVYWPALSIGLLSDDFVLLERAAAWTLIDPAWEMVRPLPLALWGVIARVLPDLWLPSALHLLNVGLHAVNAWLITLLMRQFGYPATVARVAAAAFLLFPASVEAVAWNAGVFDVLLTTLALAAVCLAVSPGRPVASTWAAVGMTGLALATKETAIAVPALILIAASMGSRPGARTAWTMAGAAAVMIAAYAGWRVASGTSLAEFPPLDGYAAKELLTRPFGALILPFHHSVIARMPLAVALSAAVVPLILAGRLMLPERPADGVSRLVTGACLWILASAAPVFTWFFVGPDLQGSRYVYLASAAWSMLIAVAVVPARPAPAARAVRLGVVVWLAFSAIAVRSHLGHWTDAGRARDAALAAAVEADPTCTSPSPVPPPEDLNGAYVFRNGFAEAWRRECQRLQGSMRP